jgi:hypothetical protein
VNNEITIPVLHVNRFLGKSRSAPIISINAPTASKILAFLFNHFPPLILFELELSYKYCNFLLFNSRNKYIGTLFDIINHNLFYNILLMIFRISSNPKSAFDGIFIMLCLLNISNAEVRKLTLHVCIKELLFCTNTNSLNPRN